MAEKLYDLTDPVGFMTPDWMGHPMAGDRYMERLHRHCVPIGVGMSRRVSAMIGIFHKGCHFDSGTHHVEGGMSADKMPLDSFYGTGVILDLRYMKKWDVVTAKDLEKASAKLPIQEGDVVLMNTGWHKYWRVNDYIYYNYYPGLYTEAGEWLLAKKPKMIGGTWGATDHPLAHYPLRVMYKFLYEEYKQATGKDADIEFPDYEPCHQIFSTNHIPAIENVGGEIDKVTGKRCTIAAFPFKFHDAGHALRVVAIVNE